MNIKKKKEVWIGLVGVTEQGDMNLLEGAEGAFTNVLTIASDSDEFKDRVTEFLNTMGLIVTEIEDVESFSNRNSKNILDQEVIDKATRVARTGKTEITTLHLYDD